MNNSKITLAPKLPRRLVLPPALANVTNNRAGLAHRILMDSGLTHMESVSLQNKVLQLANGYKFLKFLATPRNRKLPAARTGERWPDDKKELVDHPDIGVFHFNCRIWFSAKDQEIIRQFSTWLRAQRKLLGFKKWSRMARAVPKFERDLVVFALSNDENWSTEHIDEQLAHVGLPGLVYSPKTQAKNAHRKIKHKVREDIRNAKDSVPHSGK